MLANSPQKQVPPKKIEKNVIENPRFLVWQKNGGTCDVHAAKVSTPTRNKVAVLPLCAQAPLLTGSTLSTLLKV